MHTDGGILRSIWSPINVRRVGVVLNVYDPQNLDDATLPRFLLSIEGSAQTSVPWNAWESRDYRQGQNLRVLRRAWPRHRYLPGALALDRDFQQWSHHQEPVRYHQGPTSRLPTWCWWYTVDHSQSPRIKTTGRGWDAAESGLGWETAPPCWIHSRAGASRAKKSDTDRANIRSHPCHQSGTISKIGTTSASIPIPERQ